MGQARVRIEEKLALFLGGVRGLIREEEMNAIEKSYAPTMTKNGAKVDYRNRPIIRSINLKNLVAFSTLSL